MSFASKILLVPCALLALAAAAQAQASATSFGTNDFSFSVDPNSAGLASDLTITDGGDEIYNLVLPYDQNNPSLHFSPYTAMTGSGLATAEVDPSDSYDSVNQFGHEGIDSAADVPTFGGTADASVGAQRNIGLKNTGADDITLDVQSLVRALGTASVTGASTVTNFANVQTYGGVYDFDLTTLTGGINPFVLTSGSDTTGVSTATPNGFYSPIFFGSDLYYYASFTVTIAAGETHELEFYSSSVDHASAEPVPEPASLAALGLGALALVRRRRHR